MDMYEDSDSIEEMTDEEMEAYAAMTLAEQVEFLRAKALKGFNGYAPETRLRILGNLSELLAIGVDPMQAFATLLWFDKKVHEVKSSLQHSTDLQKIMLSVGMTGMWCQFIEPALLKPLWSGLAETARPPE